MSQSKTKRRRTDSHVTEGEMARAQPPEPPEHLKVPDEAMPHWWAIVRAREYDAWTGPDLEHAANLACCLNDCERLRHELREEGDVIDNKKGTPIVNPKHNLLETLSRRSVALSRMVHVHAEATAGKSRDDAKRSQKQREVSDKTAEDDDGLLAGPTGVVK